MTIADLLKATQGLKLSDNVRIDISGQLLDILDCEQGTELIIRASTPHTVKMLAAQSANLSSIASLQTANAGWDMAKAQLSAAINKRVMDAVKAGIVHLPPHGPDEEALLEKIKAETV